MSDREMEAVCVICGELHDIKEMTVLAELKGMGGRDLGYVCHDCIEHIDNFKYFERVENDE